MRRVIVLLLVLFVSACGGAPGDARNAETASLDRPLPLDGRVLEGTLDSGLRYYIVANSTPAKRAELRLVVNAGSVLEDDDQRGLAHLCEHMAFDGTKRFPKHRIAELLRAAGVAGGADLNATTSRDDTIYKLNIPTDQPEIVGTSIQILKDWSDSITFDPAELERERGVVIEEWRLRDTADRRLFEKQAPFLYQGTRYTGRPAIGDTETVKHAPREAILRFYHDWYRPDLMAIVAVGDFQPRDVEAMILEQFGSQKPAENPRPRPSLTLPNKPGTVASFAADAEATSTSVSIVSETPVASRSTERDYRRVLVQLLYSSLFNARLAERSGDPNAPFLSASAKTVAFVPTEDTFTVTADVADDGVERGTFALFEETLRIERHGFTDSEVDRAATALLRALAEKVSEREKLPSRNLVNAALHHFLMGAAMPGIEAELGLAKRYLPTIHADELQAFAKSLRSGARVILVKGEPGTKAVPEAVLLDLEKKAESEDLPAYVDEVPTMPLMASVPPKGQIVAEKKIADVGLTEWQLSNGARVVLKPTDFAEDTVRMTAIANGGYSLASDADFNSARYADDLATVSGLGPYNLKQLRKAMAGKVVQVAPFVGELYEGVRGHASVADLESLFQLTHLFFSAPRQDPAAIEAWRQRRSHRLEHSSSQSMFKDEMTSFIYQNNPRRRPLTPEVFAGVDADKAFAFYRDRFADAGAFTFIFVGNIDEAKLRVFTETYLANLPSKTEHETYRDRDIELLPGADRKVFEHGTEPKAFVSMIFHGDESWSRDGENDLNMLVATLRDRLSARLRYSMGKVYSVRANAELARVLHAESWVSIGFECAPENVDLLENAALEVVAALQRDGATPEEVAAVKARWRREREVELADNAFWERRLVSAYRFGDDPKSILDDSFIEKVSSDRIRDAARRFANSNEMVTGVLRPER